MQTSSSRHDSSEKKWILNQGIQILQTQPNAMLISDVGRRRWMRVTGIEKWGPEFFTFLKSYRSFNELNEKFESDLQGNLDSLMQNLERLLLVTWLPIKDPQTDRLPLFLERLASSGLEQRQKYQRLSATAVHITSDLPKIQEAFLNAKRTNFLNFEFHTEWPSAEQKGLRIIISGPGNNRFLKNLNAKMLASKETALFLQLDATGIFVGPVVGLPDGPCLNCLELRRQSLHFDPRIQASEILVDDIFDSESWPPYYWAHFEGILCSEVTQFLLSTQDNPLMSSRFVFDFFSNRVTQEDIKRFAGCPSCSAKP